MKPEVIESNDGIANQPAPEPEGVPEFGGKLRHQLDAVRVQLGGKIMEIGNAHHKRVAVDFPPELLTAECANYA